MGSGGYRIAIGGGSSHNERGDAVLREDVKRYRQAWRDAGHPGDPKVVIRISTYVASTQAEVDRTAGSGDGRRDLTGTPEEVIDRIHELRESFGADEIMCTMLGRALSREDILRSIRLMAEKVIPSIAT